MAADLAAQQRSVDLAHQIGGLEGEICRSGDPAAPGIEEQILGGAIGFAHRPDCRLVRRERQAHPQHRRARRRGPDDRFLPGEWQGC